MRDYATSRDYLSLCYSKFPSGSYADDSLYFMGRAYTNLDQDSTAIKKYEELLSKFPGSNYADDSLFRIGRIYLFGDDLKNAEKYFQRIVDEYPGGDRVKEIYWVLGWIQYKNGDYSIAGSTFSDMAGRYGKNQLGEQGLFWKAKCSEKLGEEEQAIESYKRIVDYDNFSYYTFAALTALERLGQTVELKEINTEVYPDNPDIAELLPDIFGETGSVEGAEEPGSGSEDPEMEAEVYESVAEGTVGQGIEQVAEYGHIDRAKELLVIELFDSAAKEIEAASPEIADNSTGILEVSTLYLEAKDYISSQKIITKNLTKLRDNLSGPYEDYLYYLLYPYGYKEYVDRYSAEYDVDPLYILALIREESRFQPDAGSFAGALGLMQIMPATGKSIASSLGISGFNNEMLFDPEKNIKMGTYYIRAQLDNFNQNKYYACGAYNGGPGAMSRWLSKYGDQDIDEFIESITFDETRKYVKKVMGSYFFYQILYGS
jgi:soluble lytic murein transglycosylase